MNTDVTIVRKSRLVTTSKKRTKFSRQLNITRREFQKWQETENNKNNNKIKGMGSNNSIISSILDTILRGECHTRKINN